ncbi:MAG: chemotaxis-specific protein-glutamate methyltransferase CheB [Treponema sp.]|jgi:two-component system chemotaxis response regulator CheB|nr:chemotaxis-specific protein-glutamate methyltransferase CheB [Treponema sp.]
MIRTLIVDDSPLVRSIIRDFLESDGSFEIVGEAENGQDGINKAKELKPSLITMDIEMPIMNGLDATEEIMKIMSTAIVVITTLDTAKMAYEATVKGACDFFAKDTFTSQMTDQKRDEIFNTLKQLTSAKKAVSASGKPQEKTAVDQREVKAVIIASSTGGPMALCKLLTDISKDFPVPIIIVQHNTAGFDKGFTQWLDGYSQLDVLLAAEGSVPAAGNVYIAPTDKHLLITASGFVLDDSEPINNQKPAADLLFKSAAEYYGNSLISAVLTGMGNDGADGTRYVKEAGGITIAQDEASSMIFGMPQSAIETGCIDMVLPLDDIANQVKKLIKGN